MCQTSHGHLAWAAIKLWAPSSEPTILPIPAPSIQPTETPTLEPTPPPDLTALYVSIGVGLGTLLFMAGYLRRLYMEHGIYLRPIWDAQRGYPRIQKVIEILE